MRPLRPDDLTALYGVASDPLIWAQHPVRDRHRGELFREFFDNAMRSGGALAVENTRSVVFVISRADWVKQRTTRA